MQKSACFIQEGERKGSACLIHLKGADDISQWDPFLPVLVKANPYSIDIQDTVTSIGQNHRLLMLG